MNMLRRVGCGLFLGLGLTSLAYAQTDSLRVVACDIRTAAQSALQVQDQASAAGALVEAPALIMLPNGMRAVQFSVRNTRPASSFNTIIKVRYTVRWMDDCGRRLMGGGNTVDGLILNPQSQEVVQSTATHPDATHASLRIYVEN